MFKNTAKTFKIESKCTPVRKRPEDVILGVYKYTPASLAVKLIADAALEFNNGSAPELLLKLLLDIQKQKKLRLRLAANVIPWSALLIC